MTRREAIELWLRNEPRVTASVDFVVNRIGRDVDLIIQGYVYATTKCLRDNPGITVNEFVFDEFVVSSVPV